MSSSVFRTIELALRRITHGDDCDRESKIATPTQL